MTNVGRTQIPKPTAQVARFSDIMGVELTVAFLMQYGGAEYRFPTRANPDHPLTKLVGEDIAARLGRAETLPRRIPLAKPWLAKYFYAQGDSVADIARKLKASDTRVRDWVKVAR